MISVGLLLGRSLFLASQVVQLNVCTPPASPVITTPADGTVTVQATTLVSGTADAGTGITVRDNGQIVASVQSDTSGDFGVSVPLVVGSNQLIVTSSNACNDTADSSPVIVTRQVPPSPPPIPTPVSSTPASSGTSRLQGGSGPSSSVTPVAPTTPTSSGLSLTLSNIPAAAYATAGEHTTKESVLLSGYAPPGSTITITDNGRVIVQMKAGSDGYFSVRVPLELGRNVLVISATTADGGSVSKRLTYVRTAPPASVPWYRRKPVQIAAGSLAILLVAVMFRPIWIKFTKANKP
jgi:hypothetical protein